MATNSEIKPNSSDQAEDLSNPTIEDMLRILREAEQLKVKSDNLDLSIPSISNSVTLASQAQLIKAGNKLPTNEQDSITSILMRNSQKYFVVLIIMLILK